MNDDYRANNQEHSLVTVLLQCGMDIGVPNFPKLYLLKMAMSMDWDKKLKVKLANHPLKFEKLNGIQIIQPAIQQGYNQCSFAAISKQLDYQLRMQYAKACIPTELPKYICLFNHERWLIDLKAKFSGKSRWLPAQLLEQAKEAGAPLWNGKYHIIQEHICVYLALEHGSRDDVIRNFLDFSPVIGVLMVKEDYRPDGDEIYYGTRPDKDEIIIDDLGNERKDITSHAVVLLDYLEMDGMLYVIYQNSDGDPHKSLRGRGISLARASLIVELFCGASLPPVYPPAVLQSFDQLGGLQQDINEVGAVLEKIDEFIHLGSELRVTSETHFSRREWGNAYRMIKDIDDSIEKFRSHYYRLSSFVRKFGDVERAGIVSSLEVAKLIKSSVDFISFFDGIDDFTSKRLKELENLQL